MKANQVSKEKTYARLDENRTAQPLTQIVAHVKPDAYGQLACIGPQSSPESYEIRDNSLPKIVKEIEEKIPEVKESPKEPSIGLGDVVSFQWAERGYDTGTVSQVHADGTVDVFRPYTHSNNFACAGRKEGSLSVICYVGVEVVKDLDPSKVKLLRKGYPVR